MKYKSMDDLRNLSDKEIGDFLKRYWKTADFIFYGIFVPNTETPEAYSGMITKVKVPGSRTMLRYPMTNIGYVSFKVPSNQKLAGRFYKFSCRLLPNYNNRCQLQILLNTMEEVDERTYNFISPDKETTDYTAENSNRHLSPIAYRYQLLKDKDTGWGENINQLVGIYKSDHDGNYFIDDIRRPDLVKLRTYPKTTFRVGPLKLKAPVKDLSEGQYCLFSWKFTYNVKVNPCELEVDESKPISTIPPEELISLACKRNENSLLSTDNEEKPDDPSILIYDLLHEADRYNGTPVDVQFSLSDKHFSFQHTGKPLTAEDILYLCGLGEHQNDYPENAVAYKCQGLRQFILCNEHTIVISNGFFIKFDSVDGKLRPEWLDKDALPREAKISIARNKRFTETIILPFTDNDKAVINNYKAVLHCVFEDVQNIAFYQNIGKVAVKIKGGKTKTLDRKDWLVSKEYLSFIPKDIRDKMQARDSKKEGDAASKAIKKKHTSIMFACRHKGNVLVGVKNAPVYCLMPTTTSFGFPFLMNTDISINKTNYAISRKSVWNRAYAEMAGRMFAKWITDLTVKKEYTAESIYSMVPKFDKCLASHPDDSIFINPFQKGFKDVIITEQEKQEKALSAGQEASSTGKNYNEAGDRNSKTGAETGNGKRKIYVIDTNVFVNCPDIISRIGRNNTVIISAKVVDELDNLKYKMEDEGLRNVQKALKNINQEIDNGSVRLEMSDVSLLPRDFDRHNPDNNILSVILRHKAEAPILLSSDNGLQIKSKALGIDVIGLKEFLDTRNKK